ncbi:MAG: SPASM domain-containing protein, partial [Desulfobacterales bacterium]
KNQYTKVSTNGGLLTEHMVKGLLDSGLHKLKISLQSLNPKRYWTIMGLPLNRTLKNIDRFLTLKEQGGYKRPKLQIVTVDSIYNHDELFDIREYWQRRGIPTHTEYVENRANHQSIRAAAVGSEPLRAFSWCRRLMEQIYVLYDGRMLQCCADWDQRSIMGDLTRQPLADIWYGSRYSQYRRQFLAGDVQNMICASCFKQLPQALKAAG